MWSIRQINLWLIIKVRKMNPIYISYLIWSKWGSMDQWHTQSTSTYNHLYFSPQRHNLLKVGYLIINHLGLLQKRRTSQLWPSSTHQPWPDPAFYGFVFFSKDFHHTWTSLAADNLNAYHQKTSKKDEQECSFISRNMVYVCIYVFWRQKKKLN